MLPFHPLTSFWNAPLDPNAPLDSNSTNLVSELFTQYGIGTPWINTTAYSSPVYIVPAGQATVTVTLDQFNPALQAAFNAVPIPPGAVAAAGTDQNMVVWQPSTDSMWEFWLMHKVSGNWHAQWGGKMNDVSTNVGVYPSATIGANNWGAPATSLPQIGGTIMLSELAAGVIPHALCFGIPTPKNTFVYPAKRTDGPATYANAIPEGQRFRISPLVNINALSIPNISKIIARAIQTYGMFLVNKSGNFGLYAEDPTPTGSDPYSTAAPFYFEHLSPTAILNSLPWYAMQAVAPGNWPAPIFDSVTIKDGTTNVTSIVTP